MLTLITSGPCPSWFTPTVTLSCKPVTFSYLISDHVTVYTALITAVFTMVA